MTLPIDVLFTVIASLWIAAQLFVVGATVSLAWRNKWSEVIYSETPDGPRQANSRWVAFTHELRRQFPRDVWGWVIFFTYPLIAAAVVGVVMWLWVSTAADLTQQLSVVV